MEKAPTVIAFDLDDTLAESKSAISNDMAEAIADLLEHFSVCVISGGRYEQFDRQLLQRLPDRADVSRLHIMPTCGTRYLRNTDGSWVEIYAHDLSEDAKARTFQALEECAKALGLWEPDSKVRGDRIEDRGSQVTYSALGQLALVEDKKEWDPTGEKRDALRERVAARVPDLEVRAGGSTSIDVTRQGIDKAFGIRRLVEILDVSPEEILFIGDRLEPGGNDYPVIDVGVRTKAVRGPSETLELVRAIIAERDLSTISG